MEKEDKRSIWSIAEDYLENATKLNNPFLDPKSLSEEFKRQVKIWEDEIKRYFENRLIQVETPYGKFNILILDCEENDDTKKFQSIRENVHGRIQQ